MPGQSDPWRGRGEIFEKRSRNATYNGPLNWRIVRIDLIEPRVRAMLAGRRQTRSSATRFVFGTIVVFVVTLACGLASHTAKAQMRIGIGLGGIGAGIGGLLLDDPYRRQKSQQSEQYQGATERNSTKKTAKARNQKSKTEDTKIAKDSPPKAKLPEPVASAPQTTPLTAGPPPTPDKFGE